MRKKVIALITIIAMKFSMTTVSFAKTDSNVHVNGSRDIDYKPSKLKNK